MTAVQELTQVRNWRHDVSERPLIIIWEMTQACPLACLHCRAEARPARHPGEVTGAQARDLMTQCADALSSTVNLNVDHDVVLCVLAPALLASLWNRLGPGCAAATPDTLQRRFLETSGTITSDNDSKLSQLRACRPFARAEHDVLRAG